MIGQGDEIEIVAGGVPPQDQHAFDPQHFGFCREGELFTQVLDLDGFQRLIPDQLPHPGFDAVQAAENLDRTLDASGLPAGDRLQFSQRLVETLPEIGQDMIGVGGQAMCRVHRRGASANEDRPRQDALEVSGRGKHLLPIRQGSRSAYCFQK